MFMWQRYYKLKENYYIKSVEWVHNTQIEHSGRDYSIVYGDDHEQRHKDAYPGKYFRTKEHAARAAERLYKRTHGAFEESVLGADVAHK